MRSRASPFRQRLSQACLASVLTFGLWSAAPNDALAASRDQSRADALETAARAQIPPEHWQKGLNLANELVRLRRAAHPVDLERLADALTLDATFLFANDRFEESDALLTESLDVWRRAYGPNDIRLAGKIEQQAELVQKGFGRTDLVIELLRQAVEIRRNHVSGSRTKLAETLTELSIHEMNTSAYLQADRDLSEAVGLLQSRVKETPGDEVAKGLLVQALVLHSGIAAKRAMPVEAERYAREADAVHFDDRYSQVDMKLIVLEALSTQFALTGQVDSAIREERQIEQLILANADLFDARKQPSLDPGLLGEVQLSLAQLHLQNGDVDAATIALANAAKQLGDSGDVLFTKAELAAKLGDDEAAVQAYRAALKLRKENAAEIPVLFGTNRSVMDKGRSPGFGGGAADLTLGSAAVLVPGAQFSTRTWLASPTAPPLLVGSATDASGLLIRSTNILDKAAFRAKAQALMANARIAPDAVLVFVHGFNVSFDDAVKRAAQLRRDLNFDGPVAVFSWPSQGSVFHYGSDRQSADASVDKLCAFLTTVAEVTGAKRVHVVAHSMGNRVLLPALAKISQMPDDRLRERLGEIILAAPAVPEAEFSRWLDVITAHRAGHVTLYASQVDRALQAGWLRERTTLAGYAANGLPLIHAGMQSIDITKGANGELLNMNHDVFASNPVMSEDIRQLLQHGSTLTPDRRLPTLFAVKGGNGAPTYWSYDPPQTRSNRSRAVNR